jgi:hypothetical protein
MAEKLSTWKSHTWAMPPRHLKLEGVALIQYDCRGCGRHFVDEELSGQRYAVHVGLLNFDRLSEMVTVRWLAEPCPGKRLEGDSADLQTRFTPSRNVPVSSSNPIRSQRADTGDLNV